MGIPGLINVIGPGERISLAKLAVTHLERTARPIRIAVDISIWLFQAQAGRGGRNPELRTLFFRLLNLLALPVHPLFVYDGPHKPAFKRGKAVSSRSYSSVPIIRRSKDLLEKFRFPWHEAPGEAEAECARLQQAGIVDAVMSNDVDALMFGSSMTIMNFSKESGSGTSSATHVTCYAMEQDGHPSNIPFDRPGMILFAMLSGGDYLPSGVQKCGSSIAAQIVKAGFGEDLLQEIALPSDSSTGLKEWRERLQLELDENKSGYFSRKNPSVRIPDTFPDQTILEYYARPKVSSDEDMAFLRNRLREAWDQDIDPLAIRTFAANHLDWKYRGGATKVTRLLAEPLISYRLRLQRPLAAVSSDFSFVPDAPLTCQRVYKTRSNFATDGMPELQLDMLPVDVVGLDILAEECSPDANVNSVPSQGNLNEDFEDEDLDLANTTAPQTASKSRVTRAYDPFSIGKIWVFESVAKIGIPDVVAKWKKEQAEKEAAKAEKARAAAAKKTGTRRAAPKKKGPLDAGMKHGSILKYGTLTKEKPELSTAGKAHLLDAATSGKPPRNPLSRLVGQSETSPIQLDQEDDHLTPSMYSRQGSSPTMRYFSQQVDDLLESFNSMCNLSPTSSAKRRPMAGQALVRSRQIIGVTGETEFEGSETSTLEVDDFQTPSTTLKGLQISYSNPESSFDESSGVHLPTLPSRTRKTRVQPKKVAVSETEEEGNEVQDIERAIESLSLSTPAKTEIAHDTSKPAQKLRQTNPQKTVQKSKPPVVTPESQIVEASDSSRIAKTDRHTASEPIILHNKESLSGEQAMPLNTKSCVKKHQQKVGSSSTRATAAPGQDCETKGHLENVIIQDGLWSIDQSPFDDLGTASTQNKTRRQAQGSKKKRIPRVSIVDLT
ncbi:unnamed protein product [Penicillium salamii]|uniref:Uncharacterized protein n=1 Tax=Penicillium salamii TaxID=1612424 RepID=A0A9W4JBE0_9EURO|nr:unnamed protein product [Penicillium salamii]CAG8238047.1 unnamed protein product [Penicillium salamii]CAG8247710.1 unnamed protein product [Penicillium salamii]CAG8260694.1 unnamed protein product [Penicillium salamii]CAG8269475.1 unnamed protein product [Penicillium salamii]